MPTSRPFSLYFSFLFFPTIQSLLLQTTERDSGQLEQHVNELTPIIQTYPRVLDTSQLLQNTTMVHQYNQNSMPILKSELNQKIVSRILPPMLVVLWTAGPEYAQQKLQIAKKTRPWAPCLSLSLMHTSNHLMTLILVFGSD